MQYNWDITGKPYSCRMGKYKTKVESNFVLKHVSHMHDRLNVLDVGGGTGRISHYLIKEGHNVLIIDPNIEAVNIAKQRGYNVKKTSFENYHHSCQYKFDLIIAIEVLLYTSDKNDFFEKVLSLLSDTGVFIFSEVNIISWRSLLYKVKKPKHPYHFQKPRDLVNSISRIFKIIDVYGFMWQPFGIISDSTLINFFELLENKFLNKCFLQSPSWLISCKKK